jgi:hypothetical protein
LPYKGYLRYFNEFSDSRALFELHKILTITKKERELLDKRDEYRYDDKRHEMIREKIKEYEDFIKMLSDSPLMHFSNFRLIYSNDSKTTVKNLLRLEDVKIQEEYPINISEVEKIFSEDSILSNIKK